VVYDIKGAVISPQAGLSAKRGTLNSNISIQGGTVGGALQSLVNQLNSIEAELVKNKTAQYPNKYEIVYLRDADPRIKNASIVSPADVDKTKWANANVKKPSDSNDATAQKSPPNNTERTITIGAGQNISAAVSQIIAQSQYVLDALKVVQDSTVAPNDNGQAQQTKANPNTIAWYTMNPNVANPKWDTKRGDWVFDIRYVIQVYETPAIQAPTANTDNLSNYPGPYKRYDYWFTGKNTEVISFGLSFETLYQQAISGIPANQVSSASKGNNAPLVPGARTGQNTQGKVGTGMEAANSYRSFLGDPGAYMNVSMTILGDPDWLTSVTPPVENEVYNKYYGPDGKTVNPMTSQTFVEVNLLEAIDYDNNKGVMTLNDSIYFVPLPPKIAAVVKGIPFWVLQVDSTFSGGKFTQVLTLNGASFPDATADANASNNRTSDSTTPDNSSGPAPNNNNSTTANNGLKPDASNADPPNLPANPKGMLYNQLTSPQWTNNGSTVPAPITTPTGPQSQPVADDDANKPAAMASTVNPNRSGQNRDNSTVTGQPVLSKLLNMRI
jgi:hypothetical protein